MRYTELFLWVSKLVGGDVRNTLWSLPLPLSGGRALVPSPYLLLLCDSCFLFQHDFHSASCALGGRTLGDKGTNMLPCVATPASARATCAEVKLHLPNGNLTPQLCLIPPTSFTQTQGQGGPGSLTPQRITEHAPHTSHWEATTILELIVSRGRQRPKQD